MFTLSKLKDISFLVFYPLELRSLTFFASFWWSYSQNPIVLAQQGSLEYPGWQYIFSPFVVKISFPLKYLKVHQVFLCLLTFSTSFRTACTLCLLLVNPYCLSDRTAISSSSFSSDLIKCSYNLLMVSGVWLTGLKVSPEAFLGSSTALAFFHSAGNLCVYSSSWSVLSIAVGIASTLALIDSTRMWSGPGALSDFNLFRALSSSFLVKVSGFTGILCLCHSERKYSVFSTPFLALFYKA